MLYSVFSAFSGLPIVLQDFTNEKNQLLKTGLKLSIRTNCKTKLGYKHPCKNPNLHVHLAFFEPGFCHGWLKDSNTLSPNLPVWSQNSQLVSVSVRCSYLSAKSVQN